MSALRPARPASVSGARRRHLFRVLRLPAWNRAGLPAGRPHFPFGTAAYDSLVRVEKGWIPKARGYVVAHIGLKQFDQVVHRLRVPGERRWGAFETAAECAGYHCLFARRDSEGKTLVQRWAAEGWRGLNNDEQYMMRYRQHSFVTAIEIRRVAMPDAVECADVFSPETMPPTGFVLRMWRTLKSCATLIQNQTKTFLLLNRELSQRGRPGMHFVGWLTHYPHFSRLGNFGIPIAADIWEQWRLAIVARLDEAREKQPGLTMYQYLEQNLAAIKRGRDPAACPEGE